MTALSLRPMILQFFEATGFRSLLTEADVEAGFAEIEGELLRLSADLRVAEVREIPMYRAANDDAEFPFLSRFHARLKDLLTLELPAALRDWARRILARPSLINGDELQLALGRVAASADRAPLLSSLARLLLFEGVRCSMLLLDHLPQASAKLLPRTATRPERDLPGLEALGLEGETLDEFAWREVEWWIEQARHFDAELRPLNLLTAAALLEVRKHGSALQDALTSFNSAAADELSQRAELERRLKRMNATDAVLLRNVAGRRFGEQRVSLELLSKQHDVVFEGKDRNAIDQHLFRLKVRLERGDSLERASPALVDLIAERLEEEEE